MIRKDTIEDDDIEGILEKSFADWDTQRSDALNDLLVFGLSKTAADARNYERLLGKYGDEHPQVMEAAASVEAGKLMISELKREIVRAEAPLPAERPETWTVYGYVFDAANEPVANAPVVLFDAEEEKIIRAERTETDANGYFRLRVENIENLPPSVRIGAPPNFMSDAVFKPEKGETDYGEIVADGEIGEVPPHEPKEDKTPGEDKIPTGKNFSDWMVTGKVTVKGKGAANLKVRVFDRDLVSRDALGETKTNADGVYRLTFTKEQFTGLGENYPELYLVIEDEAGNRLFDGKREAKGKAGRIELIDVELKQNPGKTGKLNREKQ